MRTQVIAPLKTQNRRIIVRKIQNIIERGMMDERYGKVDAHNV